MANLNEIERFLEELLSPADYSDYAPNGVQVRGGERITRVVTGVSACVELFETARDRGAELVVVHHGLFWKNDPLIVEGGLKRRLQLLLGHEITLIAYHLPLDGHPEVGNNIQLLRGLGLDYAGRFGASHGGAVGFVGEYPGGESLTAVRERIGELVGGEPLLLPFGPAVVRRVAICSGGAPGLIRVARRAGADLYLSGEGSEYLYHYCREEGISFCAAGHHRTEKLGVQAVGALLATRFGIAHEFVDWPNPL